MHLRELDLPPPFITRLEAQGYTTLYPPQEEAVLKGLLQDRNMVLAFPTASGKTLAAILALMKALEKEQKSIYIVPLRALAEEKFQEIQELGIHVALSTGDYDSTDTHLKQFDVVVTTSEKCDSLLRHDPAFFDNVHLIIADEVHLLDDPGRGPTLEMILSKMRHKRILALSATISNAQDIADWLQAELVSSAWRPVPLKKGVFFDNTIHYDSEDMEIPSYGDPCVSLALDGLEKGQILFFVNTRRSTQALATSLAKKLKRNVQEPLDFSDSVYKAKLRECSIHGVSFHHAGLSRHDRTLIEQAFKDTRLRVLVATPTLAAGINLPARRVVVRDVKRFYENFGYQYIPVLEIQQMMGRAGRPRYDTEGEAVLVARNEGEVYTLCAKYINAESEAISSKLASQAALRTHLLALLAADSIQNEGDLKTFFSRTFYVHQNGEGYVHDTIERTKDYLERHEMLTGFRATAFGRRVSELYIDPASAVILKDALKGTMPPFGVLHAVAACPDMPSLYLRSAESSEFDLVTEERAQEFLLPIPDEWEEPELHEIFLSQVKVAYLLWLWTEEVEEEELCEHFNIGPGDLYRIRESADWLLYAFSEIGRLFSYRTGAIKKVRMCLMYGIKDELLSLVKIPNIGRARARRLYEAGYKTVADVQRATLSELVDVLGEGIAKSVKKALAGDMH